VKTGATAGFIANTDFGCAITIPRTLTDQPDPELLDRHAEEVFRG
jgi:hypothetical protein